MDSDRAKLNCLWQASLAWQQSKLAEDVQKKSEWFEFRSQDQTRSSFLQEEFSFFEGSEGESRVEG